MKKSGTKYKFIVHVYNHPYSIHTTYEIIAKGRNTAIRRAKKAFKNTIGVDPREPIIAQIVDYEEVIVDGEWRLN